jgi:hypothetical protein
VIVEKIWKLANAARVGLAPRSSRAETSHFPGLYIMCAPIPPPCHGGTNENLHFFSAVVKCGSLVMLAAGQRKTKEPQRLIAGGRRKGINTRAVEAGRARPLHTSQQLHETLPEVLFGVRYRIAVSLCTLFY